FAIFDTSFLQNISNYILSFCEYFCVYISILTPNLADRKKLLGLDFMIEVNDGHTDKTMPIVVDKVKDNIKSSYSEDEFEKLIANATIFMKETFELLDKYILTFATDIKKIQLQII
ncbi:MAG: hypothetical protein RR847_05735, partial [Bacilli bacterium]